MDNVSEERRSEIMSRIRGKNTKPELLVRRLVHSWGYRFRVHRSDLPGSPDIVFPKLRKIIFVHGCFWHRHLGCKYAYNPKSRIDFWQKKFEANIKNDDLAIKKLVDLNWDVLVVWECQIRDLLFLETTLRQFLEK